MRWKRLFWCMDGRRCADVVVTDRSQLPPGATAFVEYTCNVCGTHYAWDSKTQTRRIIEELTPGGEETILGPGESRMVNVPVYTKENSKP